MGRMRVNDWWRCIQDWLLPPYCLLCGALGESDGLCDGCRGELPWFGPACRRCGAPLAGSPPDGGGAIAGGSARSGPPANDGPATCGACLGYPPAQDDTLCLFDYAPPVDHLILRLKFHGDLACARVLGGMMARTIRERIGRLPDALVPMPLHRLRLARRGYNQARELARPIGSALGVPVLLRGCVRTRATAEQSRLGADARRANVAGAFAVRRPVPAHVAVVDDVITTGHTAAELVRALRHAGARRVSLYLCARAAPPTRKRA